MWLLDVYLAGLKPNLLRQLFMLCDSLAVNVVEILMLKSGVDRAADFRSRRDSACGVIRSRSLSTNSNVCACEEVIQ